MVALLYRFGFPAAGHFQNNLRNYGVYTQEACFDIDHPPFFSFFSLTLDLFTT